MKKCSLKNLSKVRQRIAEKWAEQKGRSATDAEVNAVLKGLMDTKQLRMETPSEALTDAFNNFLNDEFFSASGGGDKLKSLMEEERVLKQRIDNLLADRNEIIGKDPRIAEMKERLETLTKQLEQMVEDHAFIRQVNEGVLEPDDLTSEQKKIMEEYAEKAMAHRNLLAIDLPTRARKLAADKKGRMIDRKNRENWQNIQEALSTLESQLKDSKRKIENESRSVEGLSTIESWHIASPEFLIESRILNIRREDVKNKFKNFRSYVKDLYSEQDEVPLSEIAAVTPFTEEQLLQFLKEEKIINAKVLESEGNQTPVSKKEALALLKVMEQKAIQQSQKIDTDAEHLKSLVNLLGSFEEAEAAFQETESRALLSDLRASVEGRDLDTAASEFSPKFEKTSDEIASTTLPENITKTKEVLKALGFVGNVDSLPEFRDYDGWLADDRVVAMDAEWDPETGQLVSIQIGNDENVEIIYSSKGKGEFMTNEDIESALRRLEKLQNDGVKVITYNGNRSDFTVMSSAITDKRLAARVALRSIDLQNQAEEIATAIYPSLNNVAKALDVKGKRTAQEGEPEIGGANAADMLQGNAVDPNTDEKVDIETSQRLFTEYAEEDVRANVRVFNALKNNTGKQITISLAGGNQATGNIRSVKPTWHQGATSSKIKLTGVDGVLDNLAEADTGRDLEGIFMEIESVGIPLSSERTTSLEAQEAMLTDLVNGLVTYEESGRFTINESELVSLLRNNNPRLKDLGDDVVNDYVNHLDLVKTFNDAVRADTLGSGDVTFDLRKLRDFAFHRRAWILTKMGETEGARLAIAEMKRRRDPNNPNSEHSALLHLERVQQDKNALRAYGSSIFNNTDGHFLAGQYIIGLNEDGTYEYTADPQKYVEAFDNELITYISSTDNMNSYERAALIENLSRIRDENGIPILEYSDESIGSGPMNIEIAKALRKLLELSFANTEKNEDGSFRNPNTVANFGNGVTSYVNAHMLARGLVDMVIGKREGVRRHLYSEQKVGTDGSLVNPDTAANPFASKYVGGVADVNHSAPAQQAKVEKVKADIQTRARVKAALGVRLTPERRARIKEWLQKRKEIQNRLSKDHPVPIGLIPIAPEGDPTAAPQSLDDIMENFHQTLFDNDILYFHFEHDSETMPTTIVSPGMDGNFGEDFTGALDPELGKLLGFEGQYLGPLQMSDGTVFLASPFSRLGAKTIAWERTYGFQQLADMQLGALINYIDTFKDSRVENMFVSGNYNNYYDGTFNGLHHLAAMLVQVNQEQPYNIGMVDGIAQGTVTLDDIKNIKIREGNEVGDFIMKSKLLLQKILKEKHNVDFHLKLASRALGELVNIALDESISGDIRNNAIKTIDFLKRHNVLTEDVTLESLRDMTKEDSAGNNLKTLLEQQPNLRSFFKPATMDRVYSAGTDTIINDLRAIDNFPTEQDGRNAEQDDDYADSFEFLASVLKGTAQKDQAALLEFGLNGILNERKVNLSETKAGKTTTVPVLIDEVLGVSNEQKRKIIDGLRNAAKTGQRRSQLEGAATGQLKELAIVDDSIRDKGLIRLDPAQSFNSTGVQAQLLRAKAIQQAASLYNPETESDKFKAYVTKLLSNVAKANKILIEPLLAETRNELANSGFFKGDAKVDAMLEIAKLILINDVSLQNDYKGSVQAIAKRRGVSITDTDLIKLGRIMGLINNRKDDIISEEVKAEATRVTTGFDADKVPLVKTLGALSSTGRAINMEAFNEFAQSVGMALTEEDLMGLENFVVYHLFGIDSASHRFYPVHHKLSMLASELAKQRGIEDGSQIRGIWDFAIDSMFVDDDIMDGFQGDDEASINLISDRIEELALRSALLETAHLDLIDPETNETMDILSEFAFEEEMTDLLPLMDRTHPDHDTAVLQAWHDRSMEADLADGRVKRQVDNSDAALLGSELPEAGTTSLDPDAVGKIHRPTNEDRHPSRIPRATTDKERAAQKTKLSHNMGPAAFMPESALVPFEHLGNPVFKEWSLRQNLERAAPVASRVDDLFNVDNLTDEEVGLVKDSDFSARREFSTKPEDLRHLLVSAGREDSSYVGGFSTDVNHEATVLEGKLRSFAKEWNVEDLVEQGLWEDLLYLYRLKPKLVALDRQLNRQLLKDIETKTPEDQARTIAELKYKRRRIVVEANKWALEANGKLSSLYDMAPEGKIPALTADVLFDDKGNPRSFREVFGKLGNKFNNLYSFQISMSFAPGEYILLNPEDDHSLESGVAVGAASSLPKYIHGADATVVMETVLSNLSRHKVLKKHLPKIIAHIEAKKGGKVSRSAIARQLDKNFHDFILENFDPKLLVEILNDIKNDPDYTESKETPLFIIEQMDGWDQILTDGAIVPVKQSGKRTLARDVGLSEGQGSRGTRVESAMKGTTVRVGITLDGAIKMMNQIGNGQLMQDIRLGSRLNITETDGNRAVAIQDQFDRVDPMTGLSLEQTQVRAQLDHDMIEVIKKRNSKNPDSVTTPSAEHGFRRSWKNRDQFAKALDFGKREARVPGKEASSVEERTESGHILFTRRFEASAQLAEQSKLIPTTEFGSDAILLSGVAGSEVILMPEMVNALTKLKSLSKEQKLILGYMLSSDTENPIAGMVLGVDKEAEISVEEFLNRYNKDDVLVKTFTALKTVENLQRGNSDYSNQYYFEARAFVLGAMTTGLEAHEEGLAMHERFQNHLRERGALIGFDEMSSAAKIEHGKLIIKALYQAARELDSVAKDHSPSVDPMTGEHSRVTPGTMITPKEAKTELSKFSKNYHVVDGLESLVSQGVISQSAANKMFVILHNLSEHNPEMITHLQFEVRDPDSTRSGTHVVTGSSTKPHTIVIDPKDFDGSDLTAIDILLEEIVHIAQFNALDMEQNSNDHKEIVSLMRNKKNRAFVTKLIKYMYNGLPSDEVNARVNYYLSNPDEFVTRVAVFFIKNDNAEVLSSLVDQEKQQRLQAVDPDSGDSPITLVAKLKQHIRRVMNYAKNYLFNVRAAFNDYRTESPKEFAKLQSIVNRVIGSEKSKVNNREGLILGYFNGDETSKDTTMAHLMPKNDKEMVDLDREYKKQARELDELMKHRREALKGERRPSAHEINQKNKHVNKLRELRDEANMKSKDRRGITALQREEFRRDVLSRYAVYGKNADGSISNVQYDYRTMVREGVIGKHAPAGNNSKLMSIIMGDLRQQMGPISLGGREGAMSHAGTGRGFASGDIFGIGVDTGADHTKYSKDEEAFILSTFVDHDALLTLAALDGVRDTDIAQESRALKQYIRNAIYSEFLKLKEADRKLVMKEIAKQQNGDLSTAEDSSKKSLFNFAKSYINFVQGYHREAKNNNVGLTKNAEYHVLPLKKSRRSMAGAFKKERLKEISTTLENHISENILAAAGTISDEGIITEDGNLDIFTLIGSNILPPITFSGQMMVNDQTAKRTFDSDEFQAWSAEHTNIIEFIDSEFNSNRKVREMVGSEDIGTGPIGNRSLEQKKTFLKAVQAISMSKAFANGIKLSALNLTQEQFVRYQESIDKAFSPEQYELATFIRKQSNPDVEGGPKGVVGFYDKVATPASIRREIHEAEVGMRAKFFQRGRTFDIDVEWALNESQNPDSPLHGFFETRMDNLADDMHKGLFMDVHDAKTVASTTQMQGMRYLDLLALYESSEINTQTDENININQMQDRTQKAIEQLKQKHSHATGRRAFVDTNTDTAMGLMSDAAAHLGRDLTLINYGANLVPATAIMEGMLTTIRQLGITGNVTAPIRVLLHGLMGVGSNVSREVLSMVGADNLANSRADQSRLSLYGLRHSTLRSLEENNGQSATDERLLIRALQLGTAGLKSTAKLFSGLATAPAAGVLQGLKNAIDGASIATIVQMRNRGVLRKAAEVLRDPEIQAQMRNAKSNAELMKVIDIVLKRSEYNGRMRGLHKILGQGHVRKQFIHMARAGILNATFLDNLNKLITATYDGVSVTGDNTNIDKDMLSLGKMYHVAINSTDEDFRSASLDVLQGISDFINYEIESTITVSNSLDTDTRNSPLAVFMKTYRQYPSVFFSQRVLNDMQFMTKRDMVANLFMYVSLDLAYMITLDFFRAGGYYMKEEHRKQYLEEILNNIPEYMGEKIARSPIIGGSQNHYISMATQLGIDAYYGKDLVNSAKQMFGGSVALQRTGSTLGGLMGLAGQFGGAMLGVEDEDEYENPETKYYELLKIIGLNSDSGLIRPVIDELYARFAPEAHQEIIQKRHEKMLRSLQKMGPKAQPTGPEYFPREREPQTGLFNAAMGITPEGIYTPEEAYFIDGSGDAETNELLSRVLYGTPEVSNTVEDKYEQLKNPAFSFSNSPQQPRNPGRIPQLGGKPPLRPPSTNPVDGIEKSVEPQKAPDSLIEGGG